MTRVGGFRGQTGQTQPNTEARVLALGAASWKLAAPPWRQQQLGALPR
jgi:hypothetical protein